MEQGYKDIHTFSATHCSSSSASISSTCPHLWQCEILDKKTNTESLLSFSKARDWLWKNYSGRSELFYHIPLQSYHMAIIVPDSTGTPTRTGNLKINLYIEVMYFEKILWEVTGWFRVHIFILPLTLKEEYVNIQPISIQTKVRDKNTFSLHLITNIFSSAVIAKQS